MRRQADQPLHIPKKTPRFCTIHNEHKYLLYVMKIFYHDYRHYSMGFILSKQMANRFVVLFNENKLNFIDLYHFN